MKISRIKTLTATTLITIASISMTDAALVVGGDFSGDVRDHNGNFPTVDQLDLGWSVKNFQWGTGNAASTTFTDNQATSSSDDGLSQVNTITTETGTNLTLSFNWTAPLGATGDDLVLTYQVVGWKTPTAPTAGDRLFNAQNFRSYGIWNTNGAGNSWADFVTGDTGSFVGNTNQIPGSFTGTAGTPTSETINLGLGALGDVGDYDIIGIKFNQGTTGEPTTTGGILDDVTLTANNIPEPSIALLSAVGLLGLMRRRVY